MAKRKTLGKYELQHELGRGGFATVYQARDTQLGREVALKLIHGNHASDAAFVERFQQEARTAAELHHAHLITVYDVGAVEGQLFLTMRLIRGPSLAAWLAEHGPLALAEALPLLQQVAQALDYLHAKKLVHRDLKPANILLEGEPPGWQATLADFGLVRSLESSANLTPTSGILGTPSYLAPEQADPKRWGPITAQTDLYALGVLLYHLLVGQPPFVGEAAALLYAHANEEPPLPTELNPQISAILRQALAKAPQERYARAGALVEAVQQVLTGQAQFKSEQIRLTHLLGEAQAARQRQDWLAVQSYCVEILKIDQSHPGTLEWMAEAMAGLAQANAAETQRRERQQGYDQAKQAIAAEQWPVAIEKLQAIVEAAPDFKDAAELLAQAHDEQGRAEAYNEAIALSEAEQWPEAARTWLRVVAGRPDYRQGEAVTRLLALLPELLNQMEQQQHDLTLARAALPLYDRLAEALYRRDWPQVVALTEQLMALAPEIPWLPAWLEETRQIERLSLLSPENFWTPTWLDEARRAAAEIAAPNPPPMGDTMTWEKDGKAMVRVPAGEFLYGDKKEKKSLPEFWIDKTPVTNAEYKRFLEANPKHPIPQVNQDWAKPYNWDTKNRTYPKDKADHPVVLVSWHDAVAYADWAGKRLPSEEEWEKAARGPNGRQYPWGDQPPTIELCNFNQNEQGTTPVGKYSPAGDSPYGCVDLAGNVWEWTNSDYDKERKVLRGGSWNYDEDYVRSAHRNDSQPDNRFNNVGCRCAVSPGS
jgi:formylglycine-generating enzyme required for sulfatase activity